MIEEKWSANQWPNTLHGKQLLWKVNRSRFKCEYLYLSLSHSTKWSASDLLKPWHGRLRLCNKQNITATRWHFWIPCIKITLWPDPHLGCFETHGKNAWWKLMTRLPKVFPSEQKSWMETHTGERHGLGVHQIKPRSVYLDAEQPLYTQPPHRVSQFWYIYSICGWTVVFPRIMQHLQIARVILKRSWDVSQRSLQLSHGFVLGDIWQSSIVFHVKPIEFLGTQLSKLSLTLSDLSSSASIDAQLVDLQLR